LVAGSKAVSSAWNRCLIGKKKPGVVLADAGY
jgi:hypothetical protein